MKKNTFIMSGGFDETLQRHQDYQLLIALKKIDCRFIVANKVLNNYVKFPNASLSKKGWALEKSISFLNTYGEYLSQQQLENFYIVQLLGPSIKTKNVWLWWKYSKNFFKDKFSVIFKSTKYLFSRVVNVRK
jgi:hypothetical protein